MLLKFYIIIIICYISTFLGTQSALQGRGGISSSTTSVQHPPGSCDGSHISPERPPHSYWWRGDRVMKPISVWGWLGGHIVLCVFHKLCPNSKTASFVGRILRRMRPTWPSKATPSLALQDFLIAPAGDPDHRSCRAATVREHSFFLYLSTTGRITALHRSKFELNSYIQPWSCKNWRTASEISLCLSLSKQRSNRKHFNSKFCQFLKKCLSSRTELP